MHTTLPRATPALLRAVEYLAELASGQGRSPILLPSLAALSRAARVSRMTMWKALRQASVAGQIAAVPGKGYVTGPAPLVLATAPLSPSVAVAAQKPVLRHPRHRALADAIAGEILSHGPGTGAPLPTVKQLCVRHRASPRTVRRALTLLVSRGIVERVGRSHRVYSHEPRTPHSTVVLIAPLASLLSVSTGTSWARDFCVTLESECARLELNIEVMSVDEAVGSGRDQAARVRNLLHYQAKRPVVGYLAYVLHLWEGYLGRLVDILHATGRPAAVYDDCDSVPDAVAERFRGPMLLCRNMSQAGCGETVGRFLLGMGHRRVAFLTTAADNAIFGRRGDGLCGVYERAGMSGAVSRHSFPATYTAAGMDAALTAGARPGKAHPLLAGIQRVVDQATAADRCLPSLTEFSVTMNNHLRSLTRLLLYERPALDLFAKVWSEQNATAWACADDSLALLALTWARRRGIRVPQALSIVGFDDSQQAAGAGLSSFSFNAAATARVMLDHLLRPSATRPGARLPIHVTPGFVHERASTGRPGH